MPSAQAFIQAVMHLFYPRLCEGCAQPLITSEEVLCMSCSLQLPKTGYHHIGNNETALRFAGRLPFQHATSFAYFTNDGLLQSLLHGLKYKSRKDIGYYLGLQFAHDLKSSSWIYEIDMIIPVPLHPKKQAKRGYNQSVIIADGFAEILNITVNDKAVLRSKNTETQTHKTREQRVNNMQDAFIVSTPNGIAGKHILLLDDVLTTGATLEACANTILTVPGTKVSFATLGIVV